VLYSSEFSVNPSFQSYSGVINTPNAQVIQEGHASLHINNQFDNFLLNYDYSKIHSSQEDYIIGFGLFSFIEVQGRVSEADSHHRDLSANIKIQLPYHYKYLPDIAIGVQDLGGAANYYDNQYIVIDKEIGFLRTSLGYGNSDLKTKKRMDGLFGSIELKATAWLYLMAENDSVENHIAFRLEMPKYWNKNFNIRTTLAYNIKSHNSSLGFTLDIPLYHNSSRVSSQKEQNIFKSNNEILMQEKNTISTKKLYSKVNNTIDAKVNLQARLSSFGFENIKIGKYKKNLYIEVENSIFDSTDLDAIGYILGLVSFSNLKYEHITLTLLKNNLKTISITTNINKFKEYILNPSLENKLLLKNNLQFNRIIENSKILYGAKSNSSFFIPRVELSLGLTTAVATEFGVLDYILALRTNMYMNIYDGLVLSAMYESPFSHSNDFEKGKVYYNETKMQSRLVNAMLHQTFHYQNLFNTVSIGKYKTDYFGILNQFNYTTISGKHAFKFRYAYFQNNRISNAAVKESYLTSYRYNYSPLDLYTEVKYGKFWYGDIGTEIQLKRFFGETSISFYYKNTNIQYLNKKEEEQIAGIQVSFPFTTRKLLKANYIQLKGKKDWNYSIASTIYKDDGTNSLNSNFGVTPISDLELTTEYLNRDRLSSEYILNHLDRLREVYLTYSK